MGRGTLCAVWHAGRHGQRRRNKNGRQPALLPDHPARGGSYFEPGMQATSQALLFRARQCPCPTPPGLPARSRLLPFLQWTSPSPRAVPPPPSPAPNLEPLTRRSPMHSDAVYPHSAAPCPRVEGAALARQGETRAAPSGAPATDGPRGWGGRRWARSASARRCALCLSCARCPRRTEPRTSVSAERATLRLQLPTRARDRPRCHARPACLPPRDPGCLTPPALHLHSKKPDALPPPPLARPPVPAQPCAAMGRAVGPSRGRIRTSGAGNSPAPSAAPSSCPVPWRSAVLRRWSVPSHSADPWSFAAPLR
jgi:hypothetical protein